MNPAPNSASEPKCSSNITHDSAAAESGCSQSSTVDNTIGKRPTVFLLLSA